MQAVVPTNPTDCVGETRGGYRLVRLLGVGPRASVYLGHADAAPGTESESTVAVKVFHAAVPAASIDSEIEAISRCRHPHTLQLNDIATAPDGRPSLIVERLGGGSLSGLVSDRERIGPGEAVTILAPLLAAVEAMHASGVVHGALRLSSVLFRASGAPVITGFGASKPMPAGQSEAVLAGDVRVARDREALAVIARAVLARVPGEAAAELAAALESVAEPLDPSLLFALADPAPVRLGRPGVVDHGAVGQSGIDYGPVGQSEIDVGRIDVGRIDHERIDHGRIDHGRIDHGRIEHDRIDPGRIDHGRIDHDGVVVAAVRAVAPHRPLEDSASNEARARDAPPGTIARIRAWLVAQARKVRARFWLLGAAVAASVVAALVLVPQTATVGEGPALPGTAEQPAAEGTAPDSTVPESATPEGTKPPTGAESAGGARSPTAEPSGDPATPDGDGPEGHRADDGGADEMPPTADPVQSDDPVLSDDPVAALGALLAERERCIRSLSVLCLDGVLQKGSAAMERDAAIIRSIQKGGEVPPEATIAADGLALVERLGDSALVSLSAPGGSPPGAAQRTPASTLVMRGEAGWRIRDYL